MIKQRRAYLSLLSIFVIVATALGLFGLKANANGLITNPTTEYNFGERTDGYPLSVSFRNNGSDRYKYYVNNMRHNVFYEEFYLNRFHWYSMVPRVDATNQQAYMARMWENMQKSYGSSGAYLANGKHCNGRTISGWQSSSDAYRYNIKLGRMEPTTGRYLGLNSGTQAVTDGIYAGCKYEWRHLGYTVDGQVITNPYFPSDYPASDQNWKTRNWVEYSWNRGYALFDRTLYDNSNKKVQWIKEKLLPLYPGMRQVRPGYTLDQDAQYWATRLSIRSNPEIGSGIAQGFHIASGHLYYVVFIMDATPRPNLRITDFRVIEKDTNKTKGRITRSATNNEDFNENISQPDKFVGRGKTYVLYAKVKNMTQQDLQAKDTTYTPINLDILLSYDEDAFSRENSEVLEGFDGCAPVDPNKQSIKYGEEIEYRCEVEVPFDVNKYASLGLRIPNGFFLKGENINNQDDISELTFEMPPEDMALTSVQIQDSQGIRTDYVTNGEMYSATFTVKKASGETPIGTNNPFATVIAEGTDFGSITRTAEFSTTQVLHPDKSVVIKAENFIAPQTTRLKVCGTIHPKHQQLGLNLHNGNDGPLCTTLSTEINVAVKDLKIVKELYDLPRGQTSTRQNLTFNFKAYYTSEDRKNARTETVRVVVRKAGTTTPLASMYVALPPNQPNGVPLSMAVNNVLLPEGNNRFEVEINPVPRTVYEYKKDGSDPYIDNVARGNVLVRRNVSILDVCETPHRENRWTTTYSLFQVNGWYNSGRRCTGYTLSWNPTTGTYSAIPYSYSCPACETTSTQSWTQSVSHYEKFSITNVYFKSKYTEDRQGGWIDIKNQPGKVKAGYGFEIRVVTLYETNVFSASPKPWSSGCSYRSVSPQPDSYSVNHTVKVTLPFTDMSGERMTLEMSGSSSGSIERYETSHQLPMRNAFGLKDTREIFVNERARDGSYTVTVGTTRFYGSGLKPNTSRMLCDRLNVVIQVIGANSDDVNTHITH